MNHLKKSLAIALTVSTLAACSNNHAETTHSGVTGLNSSAVVDASAIMSDQTLGPAEKAEKLALAGEQLTTPNGFMYADSVFDQALSVDSNNQRAKFYKALLATPMAMRGILARVQPLAYSHAKTQKQYDEAVSNLPKSSVKTFLLDGSGDIKTEKDVQAFFNVIHDSQKQFRIFLKNSKSMDITLNINVWSNKGSTPKALEDCAVTQTGADQFEIKKCDIVSVAQVKLNRPDIEALEQIAAGKQILMAFMTSYDVTGGISTAQKYHGHKVSNKVLWNELSTYSDFGKLRVANELAGITEMGLDAVAGVRWAALIQKDLCPYGYGNSQNRSGYLFNKGLCIESKNGGASKLESVLKTVEMALAGQSIDVTLGKHQQMKTQARPAAVIQSPIADLKTLSPTFNNCDTVQSVSDNTIGGVFPNHDGNQALALSTACKP